MFEFIRTHQRLMQIILMLLIVPSFLFVGVSGYKSFGDDANTVAKVAGQSVTQQEWEAAQRARMDRMRQTFGAQFDPKVFDTPETKRIVLEQLIAERALSAEITHEHLTVSDAALQEELMKVESLRKPDGSFDIEQYKLLLQAQGMTADMYDARQRHDLAQQQLTGAIQASAFMPRSVANQLADFNSQEREVQELVFPVADFMAQVKLTDAMVKAFYDKNADKFQIPEQVKVEYVVFNSAAVESQVTVSDAEVASFYTQNQKRFTAAEQRRASHILINAKKDASSADKAAAKAKAEAILAQLRKAPGEFAKVAKAQSQDPASAELGGDLDVIEKGALPKPVEDAIFSLKQGEISDVVASDFGYHIITVTSLKPATIKSLDDVKGEITAELKKQKSSKLYSEQAEMFTNTVYEQSDSLKPVADKLKLKVETVSNLARAPQPALGDTPFNNAKFLKAVFSDDALKNKRNTEAVDVGASTLIAGRVVEFKPATKRPLAEVDAQIRQRVTLDEAAKLAKLAGEAKLTAAKASGDAAGFGEAKVVARSKPGSMGVNAATAVLKADVSKLPAYVGVELGGQGYAVYRIGKVSQPAQVDATARSAFQQQVGNAVAQQEMYGYLEALKHKAKAKVLAHIDVATSDAKSATDAN